MSFQTNHCPNFQIILKVVPQVCPLEGQRHLCGMHEYFDYQLLIFNYYYYYYF